MAEENFAGHWPQTNASCQDCQCWLIANWNLGKKFQENLYQNTTMFIIENEFENGSYKIVTISVAILGLNVLTHWGGVTHIRIGKLIIIGSDNSLSPGRRQAIIWTNAGMLLIAPLGTNVNEILNGIQKFSLKKMRVKMSSVKWRPFCLSLNVPMPPVMQRRQSPW